MKEITVDCNCIEKQATTTNADYYDYIYTPRCYSLKNIMQKMKLLFAVMNCSPSQLVIVVGVTLAHCQLDYLLLSGLLINTLRHLQSIICGLKFVDHERGRH